MSTHRSRMLNINIQVEPSNVPLSSLGKMSISMIIRSEREELPEPGVCVVPK
ncbi:hypothetical protein AGABI2DRAFT_119100 [Agaricus bisporus var. bisporus H97]|uniref:hypothetical protein n=1 Tax=Agaricus bisporus var. bisporus (strain H97 / ATCC MYA-4626 / FGSC 10389) TaxID=936046 RepID=UPI00029F60CB|nr:hypothetical protein AGABI2DRAFT_119100 [Agaricus bisporus var. bisporus H97]EKV46924.1 hypothetical protein AGABI2DRAFT_119100 [Agaricus bisporus var. bisporus H97]